MLLKKNKKNYLYIYKNIIFFFFCCSYSLAMDLVASGKAEVTKMITHRYKLEETLEAFETAKTGKSLKVMIDCRKS